MEYPPHPEPDEEGLPPETDEDRLKRQLAAHREAGDAWGQAVAHNLLGFLYERRSALQPAEAAHQRARELLEGVSDIGHGDTLNNLGIVYARLGKIPEALGHHEEALAMRRHQGMDREANSWNNIGVVEAARDPERARTTFETALGLATSVGDRRGAGKAINNLCVLRLAAGSRDEALLADFQRSLLLRDSGQDVRGRAKGLNDLAIVHLRLARFDDALDCLARAVDLAVRRGGEDRSSAHQAAANAYELGKAWSGAVDPARRMREKVQLLDEELDMTNWGLPQFDCEVVGVDGRRLLALQSSGSTSPEVSLADVEAPLPTGR